MRAATRRVDVAYSNNCPYGATLVMYREAGGPGAAQAPESELGSIPLTKPPYAQTGGDRPQRGGDCLEDSVRGR